MLQNALDGQAFFLDLKKSFPKVCKSTVYCGNFREIENTKINKKKAGPTYPVIVNIYHQALMRAVTEVRTEKANEMGWDVGIAWSYMPGIMARQGKRYKNEIAKSI